MNGFEVEVEVQVDSERVKTHKIAVPASIGSVNDADEHALRQMEELYPDAVSMKVVCTMDYTGILGEFFPIPRR